MLLGSDALPEAITYDQLVSTPWLLVVAFALGVYTTTAGTRFPPAVSAPVAAAVAIKLTVPLAVLAACAALIHDVPDAFLVQAAMPTGLNSLLLVAAYSLDRAIISGAIVYSTLIVLAWGLIASAIS